VRSVRCGGVLFGHHGYIYAYRCGTCGMYYDTVMTTTTHEQCGGVNLGKTATSRHLDVARVACVTARRRLRLPIPLSDVWCEYVVPRLVRHMCGLACHMSRSLHAQGHGYYYECAACGLTVALTATATPLLVACHGGCLLRATATTFACHMPRWMPSQGYVGRSNLNYT
jgi:hypothetical protein